MTRFPLTFLLVGLATATTYAQTAEPPVDFLRSVGKIYVVVAVIVLVFLGLAYYLWTLDRRLTELENQSDDHA